MDRLLPWLRRSGWAYVAAAVALALVAWRMGPGAAGGGGQPTAAPAGTVALAAEAPAEPRGLVHVAGAVRRPGVYPVAAGDRVIGAIRRAGGPTRKADLSALNLAATLQDGQQVLVPSRLPAGATAAGRSGGGGGGPVSLSSADEEALDGLDGIGPTLAARIVEWRTAHGGFASVDQLLEVPGIGPTRLESLRSQVVP
jgi:competence protein ComEA